MLNVFSIPHQGCSPSYALITAEEKAPSLPHALPAASAALGPALISRGNTGALCSLAAVGTLDLVTGAVAGKFLECPCGGVKGPFVSTGATGCVQAWL